MCDVESYIYLPLLEELGYVPKEKYSRAPEILAHSRAIGEHFDLYRDACFQTEVTEHALGRRRARAGSSRPTAATRMRARFVVHGQRPAAPAEAARHPGHRDVRGPHVPHQPLGLRLHRRRLRRRTSTGLADKRVGIIGTGATAVQCVPHLGAAAEQLYVFQRTPSSIDVRDNRPTDPEWAASARAGLAAAADGQLQQPRVRRASSRRTSSTTAGPTSSASCCCGCARRAAPTCRPRAWPTTIELADFEKMEQIRARVDAIVDDPDDGRGAEAVLPPVLQAAVLPRRVPRHVQPARTSRSSTPTGAGVERITETRRRRRRRRVRARLPHLRHRLRGRHRLHAPRRLRARTAATA